jgi:hypothetical protein
MASVGGFHRAVVLQKRLNENGGTGSTIRSKDANDDLDLVHASKNADVAAFE